MKRFYLLYIILMSVIIVFYANITFNVNNKPISAVPIKYEKSNQAEKIDNINHVEKKEFTEKEITTNYTVKSDDGIIYVYDEQNSAVKKLDIDYLSLREFDKKLFDNGIVVDSMEQVYHIAEDFSN